MSPHGRNTGLDASDISPPVRQSINFASLQSKVRLPSIPRKSEFRIVEIHPTKSRRRNLTRISPETSIKLNSEIDLQKIETLLRSKKQLSLLQKINKSYMKLSYKQKLKESLTISYSSNSPPAFKSKNFCQRKNDIGKMVDASNNTNDYTEFKYHYLF